MSKVSVLLPVYNGLPFLGEAIESILVQTVTDIELLIIDDGSTDGSLSVIERVAAADSRVRYASRPNRGLVYTLNELLSMAKSPFIARMDSDDISDPTRFEHQLRAFEADDSLLAVGSDVHSIDSKGRRLMMIRMPHSHGEIDRHTMEVVHGSGMCHPAMMFRATAFELVGRYRADFWPAEDADLVLRIAEKGRVANLPLPLLSYRAHANSIGHTQASRQREASYKSASAAAERRGIEAPDTRLRELPGDQLNNVESPVARDVKWAWWALNNGNVRTARSLALRAVLRGPFSRAAWLVLACAVRGH